MNIDTAVFQRGRIMEALSKGRPPEGQADWGATASELSLMVRIKRGEIARHLREMTRMGLVEPVRAFLPGVATTEDPKARGLQATVSRRSFYDGAEENLYRLVKRKGTLNQSHHKEDSADKVFLPHEKKKEAALDMGEV